MRVAHLSYRPLACLALACFQSPALCCLLHTESSGCERGGLTSPLKTQRFIRMHVWRESGGCLRSAPKMGRTRRRRRKRRRRTVSPTAVWVISRKPLQGFLNLGWHFYIFTFLKISWWMLRENKVKNTPIYGQNDKCSP